MNIKKITAFAAALAVALSLSACNSDGGTTAEADVTTTTAAETEAIKDETTAPPETETEATTTEPVVEATPVEDFEFEEYVDGEIAITKYKGKDAEVIIPAEIDGKPVTAIDINAFNNCSNVADITFPDSIREISLVDASMDMNYISNYIIGGVIPFSGTPWLEKKREEDPLVIVNNIVVDGKNCTRDVEIPEGVTCIASFAFSRCSTITSISLPKSLEKIEECAFYGCKRLTDIVIPDSVNKIGTLAFGDCEALENVSFPNNTVEMGINILSAKVYGGDIPWFANKKAENPLVIVNGNLIDGQKCTGDVVIPDSVKSIAPYAFYENEYLMTSVQLPDGITKIPDYLFSGCLALKSVTIPDGVTEIGSHAFEECSIESVTIPDGVTKIGSSAFNHTYLTSITIPSSVTEIGDSAFAHNYKLKSLTLPDSVKSIGEDAFENCEFDITYKGEVYFPELYNELYAEINGQ